MIYFVVTEGHPFVKIGVANDIRNRLAIMQVGNPFKLNILKSVEGAYSREYEIHNYLEKHWVRGEWFNLTKEVSEYIMNLTFESNVIEEGRIKRYKPSSSSSNRKTRKPNSPNREARYKRFIVEFYYSKGYSPKQITYFTSYPYGYVNSTIRRDGLTAKYQHIPKAINYHRGGEIKALKPDLDIPSLEEFELTL